MRILFLKLDVWEKVMLGLLPEMHRRIQDGQAKRLPLFLGGKVNWIVNNKG
jgi:hypothetical protein